MKLTHLAGSIFVFAIIFAGCTTQNYNSNKAGYVTLLGNDTLAVEFFEKTENGLTAKVVLRSPRTTLTSYGITLDENGGISEMYMNRHSPDSGFSGSGSIIRSYAKTGDSLTTQVRTNDGTFRTLTSLYEEGILPFIDMVHWPFELAFNNAVKTDADSINQRLLTGSRAATFIIAKIEKDSMTIRHPSRGVMGVHVSSFGDIIKLDASQTTRKLTVNRVPNVDIDVIAAKFAKSDKNGSPFGSLSGAVEESFSFNGAVFDVSYGSPQKRGRKLFGGIVPYGQRWRTGANRAAHFKTSKSLSVGDLHVPAGEYTLFTIPEADGGTLIINKQTGQNGRTYDEARDLGRVPMSVSEQGESIEGFTILVEETKAGGVLKLIWGNTVYSVDFNIK